MHVQHGLRRVSKFAERFSFSDLGTLASLLRLKLFVFFLHCSERKRALSAREKSNVISHLRTMGRIGIRMIQSYGVSS